ncbi:hypothetical protein GCM10022244_54380 [Streptomyces gulbargensis]|uniref:PucR C-terminal helix-turn-helix domain-containing protein n=1 Tax=Streptomyces gulbargensis TaxID=364901 RepID=A0ABP7N904_9ACTN
MRVRQARDGPRTPLDTLTAYVGTGCVAARSTRRLGPSVRTPAYRLDRVHHRTGAGPAGPVQRHALRIADTAPASNQPP